MQFKYITVINDNKNCFDTLEEAMIYCLYIYNHYNRKNNYYHNEIVGALRNSINESVKKYFEWRWNRYNLKICDDYTINVVQHVDIDLMTILLHELYHDITDEINKYFIIGSSTKKHDFHVVYYVRWEDKDDPFYIKNAVDKWKTEMLCIGLEPKIVNSAFLDIKEFLENIVSKDIAGIICGFLVDIRAEYIDSDSDSDSDNDGDFYPIYNFEE